MAFSKTKRRLRIRRGIRKKISGTAENPRLSVYKSNKRIYAQIINDQQGHTLAAANSAEVGAFNNANLEVSIQVGKKLGEKATAQGIQNVIFDRGGYKFHGKVKALADGAREAGLKF